MSMTVTTRTSTTTNRGLVMFRLHGVTESPGVFRGIPVIVETPVHSYEDQLNLKQCQQHGHKLAVLDHYDVPTGELICYRCWGGCPDPTYDEREAAFLAWKHWGWRATGLSRRRRLRYWTDDVLSRAVVRVFGRRV